MLVLDVKCVRHRKKYMGTRRYREREEERDRERAFC